MPGDIRYVHTNVIARDWRALARFYIEVFGCVPVPPERHLAGEWIERMTAIPSVRVDGVHLALPGHENGPTLEIFSYAPELPAEVPPQVNRPGLAHLAFHAADVRAVLDSVLVLGGSMLGDVIEKDYEGLGRLTAAYVRDPEGNIIEVQNWAK